jgi:DNA-binding CsgD family transcriptional regulator/tetratricopeptide (TPR) repeat protein
MKRRNAIGLLMVAFLFAACSPYPRESERMAEAMAQAEAVYGDGSLLIETDTALFIPGLAEASQYYAGKMQYGKAALAALYNGYTERDFDKEAAMVSFKEAERYGELAHDSLTMARAEYWMGRFLFEENRNEEALPLFKASRDHIGTSFVDKAVVENSLAVVYIVLKQFDSAEICLQNSLDYAQDCCLDQMEWKIINNYSVLHRVRGEYDLSLDYQRGMLRKPCLDDTKRVYVYLNMGNAFAAMSEMDSAAFYYQRLDSIVQVVSVRDETEVSVYGALQRFAESQGDLSSALLYSEKDKDAIFEVMSERQEQAVYRIQKQYDYEILQNAMNKKIIWRHRIITVSCVLLLFMTFAVLLLQHRHRQTLMEEERLKSQLHDLKTSLQQKVEPQVVDMMVVSQLRTIITANRLMDKVNNPGGEWLALLSKVMSGKSEAFEAAKEVVESVYPKLYAVILGKYPNLSVTESRVCLLSCFDLTNAEMAELLGLSTNTVNQTRSSLRKKLELGMEKMTDQLRGTLLDGENHQ